MNMQTLMILAPMTLSAGPPPQAPPVQAPPVVREKPAVGLSKASRGEPKTARPPVLWQWRDAYGNVWYTLESADRKPFSAAEVPSRPFQEESTEPTVAAPVVTSPPVVRERGSSAVGTQTVPTGISARSATMYGVTEDCPT